jgi:hypothetical protein
MAGQAVLISKRSLTRRMKKSETIPVLMTLITMLLRWLPKPPLRLASRSAARGATPAWAATPRVVGRAPWRLACIHAPPLASARSTAWRV